MKEFVDFCVRRGARHGQDYRREAEDLAAKVAYRDVGRPLDEELREAIEAAERGEIQNTAALRDYLSPEQRRARAEGAFRAAERPDPDFDDDIPF